MLSKMPGNAWEKFANLRAYYGFMWAHPGKKLLFMGQEFAQGREWNHNQSLDWHQLDIAEHKGMQALVRDLNRVYRETPALHVNDCRPEGFAWIESNDAEAGGLCLGPQGRRRATSRWWRVVNMTPVERQLSAGPAGGGHVARDPEHRRRRLWRGQPGQPGRGDHGKDALARPDAIGACHAAAACRQSICNRTRTFRRGIPPSWGGKTMKPRPNQRLSSQAMAFVLAGGRGSRLKELTDRRAKPAVYFGGKTRIIDFALSNALNSGIRKMAIATQYKAHSLIRHCQRGWSFFRAERNEYLDILPASQRMDESELVSRHGRCGGAEHRHHRQLRHQICDHPGGRPHLQDGLRGDAAPACRGGGGCDHRLPDRAADGGDRLWRDACRQEHADHRLSWKSRRTRRRSRATRTMRWPRWGSMSSTGPSCATC